MWLRNSSSPHQNRKKREPNKNVYENQVQSSNNILVTHVIIVQPNSLPKRSPGAFKKEGKTVFNHQYAFNKKGMNAPKRTTTRP